MIKTKLDSANDWRFWALAIRLCDSIANCTTNSIADSIADLLYRLVSPSERSSNTMGTFSASLLMGCYRSMNRLIKFYQTCSGRPYCVADPLVANASRHQLTIVSLPSFTVANIPLPGTTIEVPLKFLCRSNAGIKETRTFLLGKICIETCRELCMKHFSKSDLLETVENRRGNCWVSGEKVQTDSVCEFIE